MTTTVDRARTGHLSKMRSKRIEREVAAVLGVKRNPETGERKADIYFGRFDVEVKSRLAGHTALVQMMDEAKGKARPDQTPVLVLVVRGQPNRELVVMELTDWCSRAVSAAGARITGWERAARAGGRNGRRRDDGTEVLSA